jgi:hypothetical protein
MDITTLESIAEIGHVQLEPMRFQVIAPAERVVDKVVVVFQPEAL